MSTHTTNIIMYSFFNHIYNVCLYFNPIWQSINSSFIRFSTHQIIHYVSIQSFGSMSRIINLPDHYVSIQSFGSMSRIIHLPDHYVSIQSFGSMPRIIHLPDHYVSIQSFGSMPRIIFQITVPIQSFGSMP